MNNTKLKKAFTLVELVIVIAVIAILAVVVVPSFVRITKQSDINSDNEEIVSINFALAMYESDYGIYSEQELKRILFDYGEERFSPAIAAAIVRERSNGAIETTEQLSDIIKGAIPSFAREGGHHPAKRTFQAIRIEVNGELDAIEPTVRAAVSHLLPGGRCAFISFQSLEDRIVKETYRDLIGGCTCPKDFPVCVCGHKPQIEILTKKPILPGAAELAVNPRSRSAKLRVAEKK